MRACLLAAAALLLAASTGCQGINLAKGNCGGCGVHCNQCDNCNHCAQGGKVRRWGHGQPYAEHDLAGYGHGQGHGGTHGTPGFGHHPHSRSYAGPPGPATAQVAYPYYTVRGPRDFLLDNPPSIGR